MKGEGRIDTRIGAVIVQGLNHRRNLFFPNRPEGLKLLRSEQFKPTNFPNLHKMRPIIGPDEVMPVLAKPRRQPAPMPVRQLLVLLLQHLLRQCRARNDHVQRRAHPERKDGAVDLGPLLEASELHRFDLVEVADDWQRAGAWWELVSQPWVEVVEEEGIIKLNMDGCWYESNGKAGFGGLFRDAKGDWILGFFGKLNCESSLEAELWGIYKGLQIILEKSLQNVQIESDAMLAVSLINDGNPGNHAQSVNIREAHGLLTRTDTTLIHIYHSANQCADHLAHMGAEQDGDLIVAVDIPISLGEFLIRDGLNIRRILD
ncbi:hypothetical protein RHMOL_Rhmol04G0074400 [Rhododendron molle]|uniref:Uncharacterized protein n=1 Tax=Rhododendron molle TaxID=49168 RepID=A0ACC0P0G5_RHOML|nr:hypothetical protein RHMOL_Rhmol04G0074400 [Rhododendron molle]